MLTSRPNASQDPRGAALHHVTTMVESMRTLVSLARMEERDVHHTEVTGRLAAENLQQSAADLLTIFRRFRFDVAVNDLPAIDAEIDEMLEHDPTGEKQWGLSNEGHDYGPVQRPEPRPLFRLGQPGSMAQKQRRIKQLQDLSS